MELLFLETKSIINRAKRKVAHVVTPKSFIPVTIEAGQRRLHFNQHLGLGGWWQGQPSSSELELIKIINLLGVGEMILEMKHYLESQKEYHRLSDRKDFFKNSLSTFLSFSQCRHRDT